MPIFGKKPEDCFKTFKAHMSDLVAKTVTTQYPLLLKQSDKQKAVLSFRQGDPVAVPIDTRLGRLYFYLGQALVAQPDKDHGLRLSTKQYWYRLQQSALLTEKSLLRWEYSSTPPGDRGAARHHVQMRANLEVSPDKAIDLDKAHVPCGWVTIEEVIRFLIVDLGLTPPCGDEWPERLAESERKFFEDFASFEDFTGMRYQG